MSRMVTGKLENDFKSLVKALSEESDVDENTVWLIMMRFNAKIKKPIKENG